LRGGGGVEDVQVNGPVAVDDPVPQSRGLLPIDRRELFLDFIRELTGGFAKDGEVP
jgi:hypothetical protein